MANNAPTAFDDLFALQQGATATTLTGNLRTGDGDGVDFDADANALGWAVAPVGFD